MKSIEDKQEFHCVHNEEKMIVKLQKIIFKDDICDNEKMYFHCNGNYKCGKNVIHLNNDAVLKSDSFFNSFSFSKWIKYTCIKDLFCSLVFKGLCKIYACYASISSKKEIKIKEVCLGIVDHKKKEAFLIKFDRLQKDKTICYFKIIAEEDDCIFYGGHYYTMLSESQVVSPEINLCICTYRREEYVKRNISRIQSEIFNNRASKINKHLHIIIADNAQTLDESEFDPNRVTIFKNKNAGGSGGFTRCMIESFFNIESERRKPTHIILTDDDILLAPHVLEKTYNFLSILKPEFANMEIAGIFLEQEQKNRQFCAGKSSNLTQIIHRKGKADVATVKDVVFNEKEELITYSGWWYHCIPASYFTASNLPLPFFIHNDDKEYDCRYKNKIITLNGISVWHPTLVNKQPVSVDYYDTRNGLILATENYGIISKEKLLQTIYDGLKKILYYDYNRAEAIFKGVEDFLKGPRFLANTDPVELNKALNALNYDYTEPNDKQKDLIKRGKIIKNTKRPGRIKALLKFFSPFGKSVVVTTDINNAIGLNAKEVFVYNPKFGNGYTLRKSIGKMLEKVKRYYDLCKKINEYYDGAIKSWKAEIDQLKRLDFWVSYLGLDAKNYEGEYKEVDRPNQVLTKDFLVHGSPFTMLKNAVIDFWKRKICRMSGEEFNYWLACQKAKKKIKIEREERKNNPEDEVYKRIRALKDIHKGERCFICATGPSMTIEDLEKLKNEYTFGVNAIACVFDKTDWRPTYYAVSDHAVFTKVQPILKKEEGLNVLIGSNAFLNRNHMLSEDWTIYPENYAYHDYEKKYKNKYFVKFSDDAYSIIYDGYTVVYGMIQMAIYMGFKEIYLIGTDCNYAVGKQNHFVESGHVIPKQDLESAYARLMCGYEEVVRYLKKHKDIKVFNATRGGMLELFPRVNLDEVVK